MTMFLYEIIKLIFMVIINRYLLYLCLYIELSILSFIEGLNIEYKSN